METIQGSLVASLGLGKENVVDMPQGIFRKVELCSTWSYNCGVYILWFSRTLTVTTPVTFGLLMVFHCMSMDSNH